MLAKICQIGMFIRSPKPDFSNNLIFLQYLMTANVERVGKMRKALVSAVCAISAIASASAAHAEMSFDVNLAKSFCEDEWTKRGVLDRNMFNYCMELQTDGYAEALHLHAKYKSIEPVELIDDVVTFALDKWATHKEYQFNMVAYEIEQQGEAYLNLKYELSTGGVSAEIYNICKDKWLRPNEPQWNMVEYCTER